MHPIAYMIGLAKRPSSFVLKFLNVEGGQNMRVIVSNGRVSRLFFESVMNLGRVLAYAGNNTSTGARDVSSDMVRVVSFNV